MGSPNNNSPQNARPLRSSKTTVHLVFDCWSLNKSINAAHNGNNVISYYCLTNVTDLLAGSQKCTIFSCLDLRSGYHHISLMPKAKPKTAYATTSGKWHWNIAPFGIYSLPGVFCYLMSQVLSGFNFCFAHIDNILVYSMEWKECLQHL